MGGVGKLGFKIKGWEWLANISRSIYRHKRCSFFFSSGISKRGQIKKILLLGLWGGVPYWNCYMGNFFHAKG